MSSIIHSPNTSPYLVKTPSTIAQLQKEIYDHDGIHPDSQILICNNRILKDDCQLMDCDIVRVFVPLRGG